MGTTSTPQSFPRKRAGHQGQAQRLQVVAHYLGALRRQHHEAAFEQHSDLWGTLLAQARTTAYLLEAGAYDTATVLRLRTALATYDATQEQEHSTCTTQPE